MILIVMFNDLISWCIFFFTIINNQILWNMQGMAQLCIFIGKKNPFIHCCWCIGFHFENDKWSHSMFSQNATWCLTSTKSLNGPMFAPNTIQSVSMWKDKGPCLLFIPSKVLACEKRKYIKAFRVWNDTYDNCHI